MTAAAPLPGGAAAASVLAGQMPQDDARSYLLLAAGALGGAVLRILIQRALPPDAAAARIWLTELLGAFALGVVFGLPVYLASVPSAISLSLLGGSLTSYAGASATIRLLAPGTGIPAPVPALGHFAATVATASAAVALVAAARTLIV